MESTIDDILSEEGYYDINPVLDNNGFTITFKDDRSFSHGYDIFVNFSPNPTGSTITLKPASDVDENGNGYAAYKPLVNTLNPLDSNWQQVVMAVDTPDEPYIGKGTWDLEFEATDLSIPRSTSITQGELQEIGTINWSFTNTQ